jgi:outer membrane immunogenic protein
MEQLYGRAGAGGFVRRYVDFLDLRDDTHGFLAGGQVGCDYQFSPRWVIGVAGSGAWAHITGTFDMPFTALPATSPLTGPFGTGAEPLTAVDGTFAGGIVPGALLTAHSKTEWLADATVRLGYVPWDRWLLYVKGGAAWAGDKYNVSGAFCSSVTLNPAATCSTLLPFDFRGKETRFGWTTGVGAEYAFTDWATAFIEYDFYDFGTRHVTLTDQFGNLCSGDCVGGADINQRINVVKGGFNFRFNWGKYPAPVVARY